MNFLLSLSKFPLPLLSLSVVLLQVDPLFLIMTWSPAFLVSLIFFRIRAIFTIIFINQLLHAVNFFFIFGLIVTCSANEAINSLRSVHFFKGRKLTWRRKILQIREIKLFRQLSIWLDFLNMNICNFAVPPLTFFGVSFLIFGLFGSIRMLGRVEFVVYLIVPISTLIATFFLVMLLPEVAGVCEGGNEYLCKIRRKLGGMRWEKRIVRSLRPLGIRIGQFGLVRNNLMKTIVSAWAENTMSLLIMF